MSTQILRPTGEGDSVGTQWDTVGAFDAWDCIDDVVADDGATYMLTPASGIRLEAFTLQSPTGIVPAGATINSIDMLVRAKVITVGAGPSSILRYLRLSGTAQSAPSPQAVTASYVDYSGVISRPGGGSWSYSDLSSLQIEILGVADAGSVELHVTQAYVTVDYTEVTPKSAPIFSRPMRIWRPLS